MVLDVLVHYAQAYEVMQVYEMMQLTGVVEEDVTNDVAGDNHCAEGQDGVDLVCDDDGVTC